MIKNNISRTMLLEKYNSIREDMVYSHPASLMPIQDQKLLVALAKLLQPDSIVLDNGTFLGASATIMAYANPNIKIISMDSYEYGGVGSDLDLKQSSYWSSDDIGFTENVCGKNKKRNLKNVASSSFNNFKNILFLEGKSPYSFKEPEKNPSELDVYVEDSTHIDPNFSDNLDYWIPKIKKNGLLVLHDYRPYLDHRKAMMVKARSKHYLLFDVIINKANNLNKDKNWEYLMDTTCELGHLTYCPSYIVFKKLN